MNHWLFVCANQGKGAARVAGRLIWETRRRDLFWGLGTRTAHCKHIDAGDQVAFYVGGKGEYVFVGHGEISRSAYNSGRLVKSERQRRSINGQPVSPLYVDFKFIREFPSEVRTLSLLEDLDLFSGKTSQTWGHVLQGGVRKLSKADFNRIVRAGNGADDSNLSPIDDDLDRAFEEGDKKLARHLKRERNPKLRRMKLELIPKAEDITCEACGFNFQEVYGKKYRECCEVHHRTPLSYSDKQIKVTVKDLAILCANCHRAIHRSGKPIMSVEDFRAKVLER